MLGLGTLRRVISEVTSDVTSARDRDPAAQGIGALEILSGWAGVQALLAHRVAHALWETDVPFAPRAIAYTSRAVTGVEIHPAARIGSDFFIDHGSGVVIGETAEIGNRAPPYQGVPPGGAGCCGWNRGNSASRPRPRTESVYSAGVRKIATTLNSRVFRSSQSDQFSM